MKVIIAGAGIGGLCAGIALQKQGHTVTIYEKVTEVRPVGAAISVWSNGVKCLNYLGVGEQIATCGGKMDSMAYYDGHTAEVMTQFSLSPLIESTGQRPYPVSRAELQQMLMQAFGEDKICLGNPVVSLIDDGETVTVQLGDGTTDTADLLIGADGAKSMVRDYIKGEPTLREYSGYVNWNGVVEHNDSITPKGEWTTYVGEGKRVSLMPISGDRCYFFFDVPLEAGIETSRDAYKAALSEHFKGWAEPVQALIQSIDIQTTNRVEIYDVEPFDKWVKGNVILLGDSAHNTMPDLGQGGCMAMEDAVVLSLCFAAHDLPVAQVCERYQALRAERAKKLVLGARKRSAITHAKNPELTEQWYAELRQEKGDVIIEGILSNIRGGPFG